MMRLMTSSSSASMGRNLGPAIFNAGDKKRHFYRGLMFSLGPTVVQLFIVFPIKANKGIMGLELGLFTPIFVLFYNAIWGIVAAVWLRWIK